MVDGKIEHGVWVGFCVELGKSATEIFEMFSEVFGEHYLSWEAAFE
jgi:hypothetical protein